MFGYFKIKSETADFALILPARWNRTLDFEWLRTFRNSGFWALPIYKVMLR